MPKSSKARAPQEHHGTAATTNAEYGRHALKAITEGISKAGGSVMKAKSIAADVVVSAVKDLGGFFFGDDQRSHERRGNHGQAKSGGGAADSVPKSYDDERSLRARV